VGYLRSGEKGLSWLSRQMNYVGTGILTFMMLITVIDVAGRYIFSRPIKGSIEIIEFCMVVVGSLSLAYCTIQGAQIKVDLLGAFLSKTIKITLDVIMHLLSLGFYALVVWMSLLESKDMWLVYEDVSTILSIPVYPFYFLFTIGFFMLCLALIFNMIQVLKEVAIK
jgi:TRAP-type C4-dicarboxylate transport system permease small subunit